MDLIYPVDNKDLGICINQSVSSTFSMVQVNGQFVDFLNLLVWFVRRTVEDTGGLI